MKILQVNKFLYRKGGSESYLFNLSEALTSRGVEVAFWGMEDEKNIVPDVHHSFAPSMEFSRMGGLRKAASSLATIHSPRNRQLIGRVLDAFRPDVVHLHNFNYQLTPSILYAIRERRIPALYTAHDSQFCCPYHRLYNYRTGRTCEKCVTGSFAHCILDRCIDGSLVKSAVGAFESWLHHFMKTYERCVNLIIAPSRFLAERIAKRVRTPIEILPNFVRDAWSGLVEKSPQLLYFGRLSAEKGIAEAAERMTRAGLPLVAVGEGPERERLERLPGVSCPGPKYGAELFAEVSRARFTIQPSSGFENCPMSVLESFMCGTPVVAPRHSGFLDLVVEGETGFFCDFTDAGLDELRRRFETFDITLPARCRAAYESRYSERVHVERMLAIYERLIHEGV